MGKEVISFLLFQSMSSFQKWVSYISTCIERVFALGLFDPSHTPGISLLVWYVCTGRAVLYLLSRLCYVHSVLRWWLLFRGEWPFCTGPFFIGAFLSSCSSSSSSESVSSRSLLSSSTISCGMTNELWWSFKILAIHTSYNCMQLLPESLQRVVHSKMKVVSSFTHHLHYTHVVPN